MTDNPLLERRFPIPFDRVKADHVVPAVDELIADTERRLDAIAAATGPRTFDGTVRALERATERLEYCMGVVANLEATATTPELREAMNEAQPKVSELFARIPLNERLWRALQDYAATDEATGLTGAKRRYLDKTIAEFKRHGADLDEAGKKRLAAIDVELARLTLEYAQNVVDATNAFELVIEDEAKLAGLPESARQAARASAEAKGKKGWRFTLQAPSYIPLLTYLDDASVREKVYRAQVTRATSGENDNRPIVRRVLELRREKAKLLGYATFADLVTEDRMAKSGERARAFVEDLRARTQPFFARENEELMAFRRELEGPNAPPIQAWDVAYYAEKLRQKRYRFDEEVLRPYFRLERVMAGLFEIGRRVYGVRFEPWPEAPVWHETVRGYKVIDDESGAWVAGIWVDPFPRESKRGGAWMSGILVRAGDEDDRRQGAVLVGNVTPPVDGRDAELTHREVETMFHEFGHLMHHCLTRAELRSQAGTNVAQDFVELPSQIFENWTWEREALDLFARHRDSGEPIPDELLEKMRRARTFRAANAQMRQLSFALADLRLHTEYDPERDGDPVSYAREVMAALSPAPLPPEHAMVAAFDHLFSDPVGYAAGYYSYKWAEVLDADAFTRFRAEGILEPKVGRDFRRTILERGDERDPAELFVAFMGREPRLEPLLERLGLG